MCSVYDSGCGLIISAAAAPQQLLAKVSAHMYVTCLIHFFERQTVHIHTHACTGTHGTLTTYTVSMLYACIICVQCAVTWTSRLSCVESLSAEHAQNCICDVLRKAII